MENRQLYAIAIVSVVVIAAVGGALLFINHDKDNSSEPEGPRTYTDSYGLEFTVPEKIERTIVQSGPPMTFVSYVGPVAMDTIIATGNDIKHAGGLNTYSAAYDLTPIATITQSAFTTGETEKIIGMAPDLVVVAGGSKINDTTVTFSERLKAAGIPCCILKSVSEVCDAQFQQQLRLMCDVFGVPDRAEALIDASTNYVQELKDRLATIPSTDAKYVFAANINWGGSDGFYKSTAAYTPFIYLGDKVVSVYKEITDVKTSTLSSEVLLNYDKNVHNIDMIFIDTGSGYKTMMGQFDGSDNEAAIRALSPFDTKEVYSVLPWCSRGMMPDNSIIIAYQIAAMLFPGNFSDFDMDKLAKDVWNLFMDFPAGQAIYDEEMVYIHSVLGPDKGLLDKSPLVVA